MIKELLDRYMKACHAVQSGVAYLLSNGLDDGMCSPKHLRVGLDTGKAEAEGLATLLMEKGIFTLEEYQLAMAKAIEDEAKRYEYEIFHKTNVKVTLA